MRFLDSKIAGETYLIKSQYYFLVFYLINYILIFNIYNLSNIVYIIDF